MDQVKVSYTKQLRPPSGNDRKQFTLTYLSNVDGELPQSVISVSGQNQGRANINKSPAGSTSEKNEAMMEKIVSTGSTEGNQGSAGSTDGKKIPAGSVSGNNICAGSLAYEHTEHVGGNKDHMTPAEDRKASPGSAVLKKAKCQRQTRTVQRRTPAQGRYQQRTSNCNTHSSASLQPYNTACGKRGFV